MRAPGSICLALLGCKAAVQPAPAPAEAVTPAEPARAGAVCRLEFPAAAVGPAYVLVDDVGLLKISDGAVTTAIAMTGSQEASSVEMATGPGGELWLSDWKGVRVLEPGGGVRTVRAARDGPRYEHLAVRSPTDVWAVMSESEWSLVHYDGARWRVVREDKQFAGRYDDIKLEGLAVTSDAVWVSTWNGLWRGVGDEWQKLELPSEPGPFGELWVYGDRVILGAQEGPYLRDGAQWRALGWPEQISTLRAVSDIGLVAAPTGEGTAVALRAIETAECAATSAAVAGSHVFEMVVDLSGRTWVATDHALAVVDRGGEVLAQWTPGALEGLTGRILGLAVIAGGPARLPAAQVARTWEIVGRLQTYRDGAPMAGAEVELCSGPFDTCARGPSSGFARATRAGADGSFRFKDVPEGDLQLIVRPPAGLEDCRSPFTVVGGSVSPARDCKAQAGAPGVCDLGILRQCLPFEMPPPPP